MPEGSWKRSSCRILTLASAGREDTLALNLGAALKGNLQIPPSFQSTEAFRRTREPPPLNFSFQNQAGHQTDTRWRRRKRSASSGAPTKRCVRSLLEDKQRLLAHLRSEAAGRAAAELCRRSVPLCPRHSVPPKAYVELFASPIAGVGVRAFRPEPESDAVYAER